MVHFNPKVRTASVTFMVFFLVGGLGGMHVRKFVGYVIILCFFPLLYMLGHKCLEETSKAKAHNEQIMEQVQITEAKSQLPVKMLDRNGNLFSEDYVE